VSVLYRCPFNINIAQEQLVNDLFGTHRERYIYCRVIEVCIELAFRGRDILIRIEPAACDFCLTEQSKSNECFIWIFNKFLCFISGKMPLPFLPSFYASPCSPVASRESKKRNKGSKNQKAEKVYMVLLLWGAVVA